MNYTDADTKKVLREIQISCEMILETLEHPNDPDVKPCKITGNTLNQYMVDVSNRIFKIIP